MTQKTKASTSQDGTPHSGTVRHGTHSPLIAAPTESRKSKSPALHLAWEEKEQAERGGKCACSGWGDYSAKS